MSAENICSACSWSNERQDGCRYHSNVKLFYGVSDRGVWSVGNRLVVKERSAAPPNLEAKNVKFLEANTTIPVPTIVEQWTEHDRYFLVARRIPGEPLNVAWPTLERDRLAKQTADYLDQLRHLTSPRIQSLDGEPVYSAFLFRADHGVARGPFSTDDELWAAFEKVLQKRRVPPAACQRLRERMPASTPYTFTHGDLTNVNIMVENGRLTGIIDWEAGGYFPVWWEFVAAGIGLGQEDQEWKDLLRSHMPGHEEAREFWRLLYSLSRYPQLDERATQFLGHVEASQQSPDDTRRASQGTGVVKHAVNTMSYHENLPRARFAPK
ncbi:hypothetical protein ACRALDRAFT_207150 [Sodiomyces alcalophilus JCM 7366]|uniref:uncharacterized protein n=1 Tax=Sodiomyces alcalophilus JCM 7366 TaxID=591952 RepID=UPI0039B37DCC